jgi:hypothetical protein
MGMMKYGELLAGWVLGVLSPLLVERIRDLWRRGDLRRALAVELREVQLALALTAYSLHVRARSLTEEQAHLFRRVLDGYRGPELNSEGLEATKLLLSSPWDEQRARMARSPVHSQNAPRLVKHHLPFLQTNLTQLSAMAPHLQWRAWQLIRDVEFYNDQVDFAARLFEKTFDSSLTEANRAVVVSNIESIYVSSAARAERIVREIEEAVREHDLHP